MNDTPSKTLKEVSEWKEAVYLAREAEVRGIFWAYWEFCAGFGAYDPVAEQWRMPLLDALIPPEEC